ncbi:MAG: TauD/TfdA family dioxygenase [Myxococcota bacterium]
MQLAKLSPALGVRVDDFDPNTATDEEWATLRSELFERAHLLLFRGRRYSDEEHVALARQFGPLAAEGAGGPLPLGWVSNVLPGGALGSIAASWHIDFGFFPHPYEAIALYGSEIPASGTETWFANAVAAAADLPADVSARLAGLSARQVADVLSPAAEAGVRVRLGRLDETFPHFVRPVLWPHWKTGEPILGVWEQQTDAILPLDADASTALIEELFAHLYRDEHVHVHRWEPDDLVVWDNHALQHGRPAVGVDHARTLRRVSIGQTQDVSIFAEYVALQAERETAARSGAGGPA